MGEIAYRHYQRQQAAKYIEYQGHLFIRKSLGLANVSLNVPENDQAILARGLPPSIDSAMNASLISMVDSFLLAYGSTNADDYISFRFPKTSQPWTQIINTNRLNKQLPMWPDALGLKKPDVVNMPTPPLSRFPKIITYIKGYSNEDGSASFCLPCVVSWVDNTIKIVSCFTNTIDNGARELANYTSLVSKNTGGAWKATFLSYPVKKQFLTVILSFMLDTTRLKGKNIIVLQAIWLNEDHQWIPVSLGVSPSDGYIAYPF